MCMFYVCILMLDPFLGCIFSVGIILAIELEKTITWLLITVVQSHNKGYCSNKSSCNAIGTTICKSVFQSLQSSDKALDISLGFESFSLSIDTFDVEFFD